MSYHRPVEMPSEEALVLAFEKGLKSLVQRFRNHPYAFYTESDMHCYLYHRLYQPIFNGLYKTKEGHDTILLHKEYPTIARYQRQSDKILKNDPNGRRRGHFDICIWNPNEIEGNPHRKQSVLCAAELALNECGATSVHTVNDVIKLADSENLVKHGYLLFFMRDQRLGGKAECRIQEALEDAATRVRVAFVQVNAGKKPRPEFIGDWRSP